ncbi:MAG: ATP-binding protein [Bacteroidota bacterium]
MKAITGLVLMLFVGLSMPVSAFQQQSVPFSWEEVSDTYHIRNFTVEDGLPLNSINHIVHHSDGYIYIASNDGLVRFDGDRFVVFNTSNSPNMQSNRILWMSEFNDQLWFSDTGKNLYVLEHGAVQWFQQKEDYRHLHVNKLSALPDGRALITTNQGLFAQTDSLLVFEPYGDERSRTGLLNSFNIGKETIHLFLEDGYYTLKNGITTPLVNAEAPLMPVKDAFNAVLTRDNTLWILGNNSQLLEITQGTEQTLHTYRGSPGVSFWDVKELSKDELLLSTSIGYLSFNRLNGTFRLTQQTAEGEDYFEDNTWIHIKDRVVTMFQNAVSINGKKVLEIDSSIPFLTGDKEGSVWVATNGDGMYQITPKKMATIGNNLFPGLKNVYGVTEDALGTIWATSFEQQIFRLNDTGITNWTPANSTLSGNYFRPIYASEQGAIYTGNNELWKYEEDTWERVHRTPSSGRIHAIHEDNRGRFWVGKDEGLFLLEQDRLSGVEGKGISNVIGIKDVGNTGDLAIYTLGRGIVLLLDSGEVHTITVDDGLTSNRVRDVHVASAETLWVATEDKGLNRVRLDENYRVLEIKTVNASDGLIDNSLHRIIDDGLGYFWINSNKGIMRLPKAALHAYMDGTASELPIQSFGEDDGLENAEGNGGVQHAGVLTSDGKLLFPNQAGMVYTRPEWHINSDQTSLISPVLETVSYSDTSFSVSENDRIVLPKHAADIQFKITLPTFVAPRKLVLEYKMEGVNQDWQKAGTDRTAIFTKLPAGDHTLLLRGKSAGDQSYAETRLIINKRPLFIETIWFWLLITISVIGLFMLGLNIALVRSSRREMHLNRVVQERTQELQQEKEKTEEALEHIKELDEFKSKFFTNFTHELRTPLSLILNPLEDMLENSPVEVNGNKDSLALMARNAHRLKSLVNQLLDVSKLSSGELTLSFEPTNIQQFTAQIAAQFEHAFSKKEIRFEISPHNRLSAVCVDRGAWNHICSNLLSNALKFTSNQGTITVLFEEQEHEVMVHFTDTGTGIPHHELPRIFDSYYQGSSSISVSEGTGIGLALVKGLTERMGGSISVTSTEGEGSTFSVVLKKGTAHISSSDIINHTLLEVPDAKARVEQVAHVPEPVSGLHAKSRSQKKVLLVEDNEDFRIYLRSVIASEYDIMVATNGKEGLDALDTFKPDIIVSDIMMPEMNGYDMMRAIRNLETYKNIPFIFLSAKDSAADIETGLNLGADIYLSKPVRNNILLTQIKVLLRREHALGQGVKEELSGLKKEVYEIIQRHLGNPDLNVELIANALSMSPTSLYRNWKKESTTTINQTITSLRLEEAIKLVQEEGLNISEVALAVGYKHLPYFSKAFKRVYGKSPSEYFSD